jgi:hypothetical protein
MSFRWGGLGRLDGPVRIAYIAAMASMGRIVAVLQTRSDRDGEVYTPVLRGALLGQVNDMDELTFPASPTTSAPSWEASTHWERSGARQTRTVSHHRGTAP